MKITLREIKDVASSYKAYDDGLNYFKEGKVEKIHLRQDEDYIEMMSCVHGDTGDYQTRVELYNEKLAWCECNCLPSFQEEGACKHVEAMLLKYYYEVMPDIRRSIKGERYSQNALNYYEDQVIKEQDLELGEDERINAHIKLIDEGAGSFFLGLSVGANKFYIVKDLYEFAEHMLQGNRVVYGKNLDFIHDISVFDEAAKPIVQFIVDKTQEYLDILRQVGMYRGFTKADRKTLPLGPKAFDEFFDLIKGQSIEVENGKETREVLFAEGNPRFEFKIEGEGDYYELSTSLVEYEPIAFSRYKYILLKDRLLRLDKSFGNDVFPLLKYMYEARNVHGNKQLDFSETLIKRFILSSLAKIEKHVPVVMNEDIKTAITPEHVHVKTFLDLDGEGNIIGDIQFQYKGFIFNPYKKLDESETRQLEQIARDTPNEYRVSNILKYYNFRTKNGGLHLSEEEDIYAFVRTGINELMELGEVHVTERLRHINLVKSPMGSIGLRIENNMLKVELKDVNMPLEEMAAILNAYKMKNKYYRLRDGSFLDIAGGTTIGDLANIVDGLGMKESDLAEGEASLPKYRALYLDQVLRQSEGIEVSRDKYFKQIIRDVKNVEDADYEVPKSLKANLRTYQKTGYRWLRTMAAYGFGGILADDMGLGKTLQMIALILAEKEENEALSQNQLASQVDDKKQDDTKEAEACNKSQGSLEYLSKPSLVICPTSLVLNWQTELARFAPSLKVLVIMGTVLERKTILEQIVGYDVVITSYELLKRDIDSYEEIQFRYCIADEAQYIKNANTLSAKALKLLKSEVRFALTGTPIENSLAELWSIFDFIMPEYLFGYAEFRRHYEMPIVKSQDEVVTARLKKLIAPFVMRRLKKDVLKELPDKTETVIYNTMEEEQQKLYTAHLALAKKEMEEELKAKGAGASHIKMLALLTRLRQLCCHPSMYLQDYAETSGKLEQCMEIVKDSIEAGHKILLFSQFTTMLDILSNRLYSEGIEHFMLTGSTKAEERMRLVNEFNTSDIPVFLISLKAGGTGLNLTGADVVIHYDPWWNLSSQNQATDRAYRIGQKNKVQVFQMITKNSIEEKIKELQDKKIGLTESVLQEGESFISKMSEEEIKALFSEQ